LETGAEDLNNGGMLGFVLLFFMTIIFRNLFYFGIIGYTVDLNGNGIYAVEKINNPNFHQFNSR
jgi:hypothetical protein